MPDLAADDLPFAWNAGHCAKRLIHGYHVLVSRPDRIGPTGLPRAWPEIVLEFSDLIEGERESRPLRRLFPAAELALAEEAMSWPMEFLADVPHRAEAVQIWAYAKATRRSLRRILRQRRRPLRYRIRSDTTLRRYLGPGLELLAARLDEAGIPVR